jgi:Protein of unknown function (DUF2452)
MTASSMQLKNPNPQGKGLVPVLDDLNGLQLRVAGTKTPTQFLKDYFISSLVLSARFRFRPVVGTIYYLYAGEPEWLLSLIGPEQWHGPTPGDFIGACELRADMTWHLDAQNLESAATASRDITLFIESFIARITEGDSVAASLPFYLATLPYHQRMLATALAASLRHSLKENNEQVALLLSDRARLQKLLGPAQAAS